MENYFTDDCIYNIIGCIRESWNYDFPTGKTLEKAIFRGIKPFYSNVRLLGSPNTIVDVGKDNQAFDIKGSQSLGHLLKITKSANKNSNDFVHQSLPNGQKIFVRIPKYIVTQVRRPKVDLKNYKGDPKKIIDLQIKDYMDFSERTTKEAGYDTLSSMVLLYGIDKGIKSIFLSINDFENHIIKDYKTGFKTINSTKKVPSSYEAVNENGEIVYKLSSFNKGSSNFYKKFTINNGILVSWPEETKIYDVFKLNNLEKDCTIKSL